MSEASCADCHTAAPTHPAEVSLRLFPPYALIALYARLTSRGKPHKAALTACARKLLIYANTIVQRQTPWTEKPATT